MGPPESPTRHLENQEAGPHGIQAALDAWDQSQNVEDDTQRQLTLALEKARYEASRIERQAEQIAKEMKP